MSGSGAFADAQDEEDDAGLAVLDAGEAVERLGSVSRAIAARPEDALPEPASVESIVENVSIVLRLLPDLIDGLADRLVSLANEPGLAATLGGNPLQLSQQASSALRGVGGGLPPVADELDAVRETIERLYID